MFYEPILVICIVLLGLMINSAIQLRKEIKQLAVALEKEKHKRSFPLLAFELDVEGRSLYVTNDSYCYAKKIAIQDFDLTLHMGFEKHLTLKFDTIDLLKPGKREKITFRVFDHGHEITSSDSPNLVYYFPDTKVTFHIRFENIEEDRFESLVINEGKEFIIKHTERLDDAGTPNPASPIKPRPSKPLIREKSL
ncbi:MAG: hypothetical protein KC618_05185 [Candidatus Omnitrophica bacterium]|nr:hypothetical protein [Candidatus Omnitrophota bacterium]